MLSDPVRQWTLMMCSPVLIRVQCLDERVYCCRYGAFCVFRRTSGQFRLSLLDFRCAQVNAIGLVLYLFVRAGASISSLDTVIRFTTSKRSGKAFKSTHFAVGVTTF